MTSKRKWLTGLGVALAVVAAIVLWTASELSKCRYSEASPGYSPDKKFYYQMQFTVCRDSAKTRAHLVMGEAGKPEQTVLLDFGSSIGTVNISWQEGPELHVEAPDFAITKRYGPYDELPPVVVTNP